MEEEEFESETEGKFGRLDAKGIIHSTQSESREDTVRRPGTCKVGVVLEAEGFAVSRSAPCNASNPRVTQEVNPGQNTAFEFTFPETTTHSRRRPDGSRPLERFRIRTAPR